MFLFKYGVKGSNNFWVVGFFLRNLVSDNSHFLFTKRVFMVSFSLFSGYFTDGIGLRKVVHTDAAAHQSS